MRQILLWAEAKTPTVKPPPIGAVTHVDEPGFAGNYASIYFGLWAGGKNFAACAWNSRWTPYLQAVGDPWITAIVTR